MPREFAARRARPACRPTAAQPVLFGVDLQVHSGEVVALLGRNGMGKTTLVRSVMGIVAQRRRACVRRRVDPWPSRAHRIARRGIALVPEAARCSPI